MSSKYLANGTIIGGHYEIIDVLGEDDFEILYLVKNIHREGSFFVIKELFLEVFSERKGDSVETIPEAQGVFNKRKAEIIREINHIPRRHIKEEIKVFAYFEENNTIYSCMAYTPNAKVEAYLQFEPKEDTKLPRLEELTQIGKENKRSSSLLLVGVVLLTVIGGAILAFNQYGDKLKTLNMWNSNKHIEVNSTQEKNDTLKKLDKVAESNRTQIKEKKDLIENNLSLVKIPKKEISVIKKKYPLIEKNITKEEVKDTNLTKKIVDENITNIKKDNKNRDTNLTKIVDNTDITKMKETNLTKKESIKKISHHNKKNSTLSEIFSEIHIHKFLNNYMKVISHSSSKNIMKLYDNKIKRYFQFKNITPQRVRKSVLIYNRKWKYRNFKLLNFKILKRYSKNGVNYCDIKTSTKWYVSNSNRKKRVGYAKNFMTIKDTKSGFKVKAIYGIK